MQFYLASAFRFAARCEFIHRRLLEMGYDVPDVWWNVDRKIDSRPDLVWYADPVIRTIATRHWRTIRECDAVILVSAPGENKFTRANVEVGYALGIGKPVFSIGPLERCGMYAEIIRCATQEELEEAIRVFALSSEGA